MITNVQVTDSVGANSSGTWRFPGWPVNQHVIWYVIPTAPRDAGIPQLDWDVAVERSSDGYCTYWLTVRNVTNSPVSFEGRFAILNV